MSTSGTSGDQTVAAGEAVALKIFLSYRRDDAAGHAGHLFDDLTELGRYDVFMDIEKIGAGLAFKQAIDGALASCDVFLALIGRRWLDAQDSEGRVRLENPEDLVRLEVGRALAREDVRVVPVLVQDAEMPSSEALPEPLKALAERNAHDISDKRWRYDVEQLVVALDEIAAAKAVPRQAAPKAQQRPDQQAPALGRPEEDAQADDAAVPAGHERGGLRPSRRAKIVVGALVATAAVALGIVGLVALLGGEDGPDQPTAAGPTTTAPTTSTEPEVGNPEESVGDPFPYDPAHGTGVELPKRLTFSADRRQPDTIPFEAGFTGLMTDGKTPLKDLFDPDAVELGEGVLQIRASSGDPLRQKNGQLNAFQFGVGSQEGPFTAHARLPAPFRDLDRLQSFQSLGIFLGTGDQDNYAKLVVGTQGFEFRTEVDGKPPKPPQLERRELLGLDAVDLFLRVVPAAAVVEAWFTVTDGGQTTAPVHFAQRGMPRSWLDNPDSGLAVGIISTTGRDGSPFEARWDVVEVTRLGAAG
jgi:hypothetical protein